MSQLTDENECELLAPLRNGDIEAFNQYFRRYHAKLVFFSNRILMSSDLQDAEEVVQDVFVKFFNRRTKFESGAHIKAFLYLSAKNACLDIIAKEKVRLRRYDAITSQFEELEDNVVAQIVYTELIQQVNQAIDLLPNKCRAIIKKFLDEGKNAQEIAQDMNLTVSTVNNQRARGIRILRSKLSAEGMKFLIFILVV
ncbi:RNA polymerase sigma factor [Sphingobacterium faecale]|uniref:RNA polymerase sigma-70 factor n=1 Tax=Sphingobacterium faecale TaxID=2803775 RepID=A0ABS1R927_9SPHI|nr:RNA polymerase sigma-70 factor [Sphingobacterium faecale]MBL1411211.1 RNA polymerase sigma-70 factor [Sphingobacterium faecale]